MVTDGIAIYSYVILFNNRGIGSSGGQTLDKIETMAHDVISFVKAIGNLCGDEVKGTGEMCTISRTIYRLSIWKLNISSI